MTTPPESPESYPMRINKYLAHKKLCTRRAADELIEKGLVTINGTRAKLGDQVHTHDHVEARFRPRKCRYFAYYKPRGVITHSAQGEEQEIKDVFPVEGVFPVGRLDKDSCGLIILTDDGRLSEALLSPEHEHEKEYEVVTLVPPPSSFRQAMQRGVDIGGYRTKPCKVRMLGDKKFSIVITEGKKHQIRRMCGALGQSAVQLKRVRILNIHLSGLKPGGYRKLRDAELGTFLASLGIAR